MVTRGGIGPFARFAGRRVRVAPGRALSIGLVILVASTGFITLTSAVRASGLQVHHLASSNYRGTYDILVRPTGSQTSFEQQHHLVQANYLGGTYGGITITQWQEVLHTKGVAVAAPIANVGYVTMPVTLDIHVPTTSAPVQLYRVKLQWTTDNGLSHIPGPEDYVYITDSPFKRDFAATDPALTLPYQDAADGTRLNVCSHYPGPATSVLAPPSTLACVSTTTPMEKLGNRDPALIVQFPVLLAGIDPVQESKLLNLSGAITQGHYLSENAGLSEAENPGHGARWTIQRVPVLAANATFVGATLTGEVTRLDAGTGSQVARLLADDRAPSLLARLHGKPVSSVHVEAKSTYAELLRSLQANDNLLGSVGLGKFWSILPARYRTIGDRHVAALTTTNPVSVWDRTGTTDLRAPPGTGDVQFHAVVPHAGNADSFGADAPPGASSDTLKDVSFTLVGTYDPGELPGFSSLSQVPLQSYYPPTVTGATDRDRRMLGDRPLGPDMNLAGYVSQPPLLLTTIKAAAQMQDPRRYAGANPDAPISSIRVKVAGLVGLDAASQARVRLVAQNIAESTGLQVQITAGSSPTPVNVDLPAGKFGRPALTVSQNWIQQGAVTDLVTSVDVERLAMFILVLVAAALLVAGGVNATVRARRTELGVLAALGWTPRDLARVVRTELLAIAVVAGSLGIGTAVLLVWALHLHLSVLTTLLVLPVAIVLALLAGWWPTRAAARTDPTRTIVERVSERRRGKGDRSRQVAWAAIARRPGRAVLGGLGLALGVAAITVLLAIELRFQDQVSTTLLGQAAILRVQSAEFAAAALIAVFGAASVADVVGLDLAERSPEFATLAATGWTRGQLTRLATWQGVLLGATGSLVGAFVGLIVGTVLTASFGFVLLTALIAFAGGVILAVAATSLPIARAMRLDPARALAAAG